MCDYDVIIVGASFAGLAVANQLHDQRVLLIDHQDIGSGQTSACGTMLQVLEYWDLSETVLQTNDAALLHTARNTFAFPSPYGWCTFDYQALCEALFERSGADFLKAAVQGTDGNGVFTNHGDFHARCLVDASGWRAVLASSLLPGFAHANPMNFGIDTIQPIPNDTQLDQSVLHFWYDPAIVDGGLSWVFSRSDSASVGIGSYNGATHLRRPLIRFAERFAIQPDGLHGAYFPHSLRKPTVGRIFVVGDAAGMCIGLTGEGIRPALFFGEACGCIVQRVLAGDLSLEEGLDRYAAFVERRRTFFRVFSAAQKFLTSLPSPWIDTVAQVATHPRVRPWVLENYWALTCKWDQ
jgi:flavin-dependent dehydrogenase